MKLLSVLLLATNLAIGQPPPPKHIVIAGTVWSIKHNDAILKRKLAGETFCDTRVIQYSSENDLLELRNTIWHEIFHAAACSHGGDGWWNSYSDREHPGIFHLAEFVSAFVIDNPEFVDWSEGRIRYDKN